MKNSVIAIQSFVITTIVYALLVPVFFEMDNALEKKKTLLIMATIRHTYSQQVVESECKSPCSSTAEMCIEICA